MWIEAYSMNRDGTAYNYEGLINLNGEELVGYRPSATAQQGVQYQVNDGLEWGCGNFRIRRLISNNMTRHQDFQAEAELMGFGYLYLKLSKPQLMRVKWNHGYYWLSNSENVKAVIIPFATSVVGGVVGALFQKYFGN